MALPHRERYVCVQWLETRTCIAKKTASPAGCVRPSQAGTKLERTQTAAGLLRIGMQVLLQICLRKRKSVLQFDATTHDKHYWSSWFFWHRRYGRMLIDPVCRDLMQP